MDPAEDEELCAALDKYVPSPTPPRVQTDAWQKAVQKVHNYMSTRPDMKDLHDDIDEIQSLHTWPDKHFQYFYGILPLNKRGHYTMVTFFWYNGINPEWAVEWFRYMGAFTEKPQREKEMRDVFKDLEDKVQRQDGRATLQEWHVFDMEKMRWFPCWEPTEEMVRGVNNVYMYGARPQIPDWVD
jgi:hypothetical protein